MFSELDKEALAPSWRDDKHRRMLVAMVLGGAAVLLPLLGVVASAGNFYPYGNRVANFLVVLVWWPMPLLGRLLPESRADSGMGCAPPESILLLSPILSILIYAAIAFAALSLVARRTRLK